MMNANTMRQAAPWLALLVLLLAGWQLAWADDDDGRHKRRRRAPESDPVYAEACGQCHLAYPPCLLPAASWRRLLAGGSDHWGQDLALKPEQASRLEAFLAANAADQIGGKRGRKIMAGLAGGAPLRLSDTPYILHKHEDIGEDVFRRPAVGGRGNCKACHPGAEAGDFDDDRARIPPAAPGPGASGGAYTGR